MTTVSRYGDINGLNVGEVFLMGADCWQESQELYYRQWRKDSFPNIPALKDLGLRTSSVTGHRCLYRTGLVGINAREAFNVGA